jgi:hypothetical protein
LPITEASAIDRTRRAQLRGPYLAGWRVRYEALALAAVGLAALVAYFRAPTYPSYDGYYSLVWAQEIARGVLPGFEGPAAPTEHPMALVLALLALPFGDASDRVYVLFSIIAFVGLVAGVYALAARAFSRAVGAVAALIVLTRIDLLALASRGFVDVPFLALVVWAGAEELRRPCSGRRVFVLLGLAGLFRPEGWLFAGLYLLYRFRRESWRARVEHALLVAVAPLIWLSLDLAVTGNPFFSLTATRELAGELGRSRAFGDVLIDTPHLLAETVKLSVLLAGLAGLGYGVSAYERRMRLPLALALVGLGSFLATSALGLSVNVRYLSVPSVVVCIGAAVAVAGFTVAAGRMRRIGIALAILAAALMIVRLPSYRPDVSSLRGQAVFVREQHDTLADLLRRQSTRAALARCGTVTVPSHQTVPIVRRMLDANASQVVASTFQTRPPHAGLLLIAVAPRFKVKPGPIGRPNWWANLRLPAFQRLEANRSWELLATGCARNRAG